MGADRLKWMLSEVVDQADEWPVDKTGRWLGYVQGGGALVAFGALDRDGVSKARGAERASRRRRAAAMAAHAITRKAGGRLIERLLR